MNFPEIEGITWLSTDFPDIVIVKITLEDKRKQELDLPDLDINDIEVDQYIDLSRVAGVRAWYPWMQEEPSKNECMLDVEGIVGFVANISIENMIKAWIIYKNFYYATRNT